MLGELTPLEETRAYKELVAKGEGRGRQREARLVLRRIGPVAKAQQARIVALPIDELEALGEALLDFVVATDLDAWLVAH